MGGRVGRNIVLNEVGAVAGAVARGQTAPPHGPGRSPPLRVVRTGTREVGVSRSVEIDGLR